MSVLIKHMAMPKGCIYANDKDQTEYCPLLNHDDVPFCQYIENEPEIAIGIDERPVYCPISDVPEPCQDTVSRQAAINAIEEVDWYHQNNNKDMVHGANSSEDQAWYKADDIYKTLEALPSAQPEQKKGKWKAKEEREKQEIFICSECGGWAYSPWIGSRKSPKPNRCKYAFCPNCGADMRGEEE